MDPYSLDLARRDGAETTAAPPAEQDFWVASEAGVTGLDLSWPVQNGDYRAVLMNADGTAGVQYRLGIGVGLDGVFGLSLGLLVGGTALILLAIALLVATRPRPPVVVPSGYAYPPSAANGPATGNVPPTGHTPRAATAPRAEHMPSDGSAPVAEPAPPVREPRS